MPKNDATDVSKIISENKSFRSALLTQFEKEIYPLKEQWNSDVAISFLEGALNKFNEMKAIAQAKLNELNEMQANDDIANKINELQVEILVLDARIKEYTETWLERKETLYGRQDQTVNDVKKEIIEFFIERLEAYKEAQEQYYVNPDDDIRKKIEKLTAEIKKYQKALEESSLTVSLDDICNLATDSFLLEFRNPVKYKPTAQIGLVLKILKHPELASQIPLDKLDKIVDAHRFMGIEVETQLATVANRTVYSEISKRVCEEIKRRLNTNETPRDHNEIKRIQRFYEKNHSNLAGDLLKSINQGPPQPSLPHDGLLNAFKHIYQALYDGQSGPCKINSLSSLKLLNADDAIKKIQDYSTQHPDSRMAKAWNLAQTHYLNFNPENTTLFTEIYKWSFQHSWLFKKSEVANSKITFFKSSTFNKVVSGDLTVDEIKQGEAKPNSRTAKIANALRK